ncbi:diguanylate cyclase [Halobacteriales archaeon QS_1_68_20]|nr:MAG: diguanylate cyclase [Halobacteriales archaeon QS_1_68_20]
MTSADENVLSETLAVFDGATAGKPLTTSEVAADLDCSRRATYDRLERLAERGDLRTKKVGARGRVWWRPQSADAEFADSGRPVGVQSEILANLPGMVYRCRATPERPMSFVSEGCREVAGYDPAAFESGERRWDLDVVHPADRARLREEFETGLASDGRFEVEYRIRTADCGVRWVRDRGRAADGDGSTTLVEGVVVEVSGTDGPERTKADHDESRSFVVTDASVVLDPAGQVETWNAGAEQLLGYAESEVVGEHVSAFYTEADRDAGVPGRNLAEAEREGSVERDGWQVRADGSRFPATVTLSALRDDEGTLLGYVTVIRDLTERRAYERRLRRERDGLRDELAEVFERIDDGVQAFDEQLRYTYVNERAEELLGEDEGDLLGEYVWDAFPEAVGTESCNAYREALRTQEPTTFERRVERIDAWVNGTVYPSETGLSVYLRDVTEQKERERALEALHDVSRQLLAAETGAEVSEVVAEAATEVLDLDVVVYRHDGDRLHPEARSDDAEFIRRSFPDAPADDSLPDRVFVNGGCRRYADVRASPHYRSDGEMRASLFVPMADHGLVVAGSREVGSFDEHVRQLVEVLAANAEATYDRVEREGELQRQRERLAALNELNAVVRETTEALIEQSTHEGIERAVCERLADSASYEFAWIGAVGRHGDEVTVRTESGVDGALDDATVSVDPDHPASDGPTARALRTREVQVATDVEDDRCHPPVDRRAYRSMAAIPIDYEDVLYGVLNVYASRPDAFTGEEREVVDQLGDVVGHAINAADRKRALMTDDVTEVQFRLRDIFEQFGIERDTDGTITFDRTIPVGDGVFLIYGTATDEADEVLVTFDDRVPSITDVTILDRDGGETKFELRVVEPPVIALVASQGGDVRGATIDDGDYYVTFHLPPDLDVREVLELAEEAYPPIEMVTRRQVTRTERTGQDPAWTFLEELTDRQRAALLAGYYSGFFDWPRVSSGEEVAESLDVSPSTFHQHVRIAERKLLESVVADDDA